MSAKKVKETTSSSPEPASRGAFEFGEFEYGIVPTKRSGPGGVEKYDWSKFPAPKDPSDAKTWPSVVVPIGSPKSLYTSIKRYRERLVKAGTKKEDLPDFSLSRIVDGGKVTGVRVYRSK